LQPLVKSVAGDTGGQLIAQLAVDTRHMQTRDQTANELSERCLSFHNRGKLGHPVASYPSVTHRWRWRRFISLQEWPPNKMHAKLGSGSATVSQCFEHRLSNRARISTTWKGKRTRLAPSTSVPNKTSISISTQMISDLAFDLFGAVQGSCSRCMRPRRQWLGLLQLTLFP
jgi:hypothetical protein